MSAMQLQKKKIMRELKEHNVIRIFPIWPGWFRFELSKVLLSDAAEGGQQKEASGAEREPNGCTDWCGRNRWKMRSEVAGDILFYRLGIKHTYHVWQ